MADLPAEKPQSSIEDEMLAHVNTLSETQWDMKRLRHYMTNHIIRCVLFCFRWIDQLIPYRNLRTITESASGSGSGSRARGRVLGEVP